MPPRCGPRPPCERRGAAAHHMRRRRCAAQAAGEHVVAAVVLDAVPAPLGPASLLGQPGARAHHAVRVRPAPADPEALPVDVENRAERRAPLQLVRKIFSRAEQLDIAAPNDSEQPSASSSAGPWGSALLPSPGSGPLSGGTQGPWRCWQYRLPEHCLAVCAQAEGDEMRIDARAWCGCSARHLAAFHMQQMKGTPARAVGLNFR